jgi:hypothetical protein
MVSPLPRAIELDFVFLPLQGVVVLRPVSLVRFCEPRRYLGVLLSAVM